MSAQSEVIAILKELLFNRFYPKPDYIRGLLGDGQGNVIVPNRPDYNYVRFNRSSTNTFEVFNKEVSQPVDGWPILLGELPWQPGLFQVVATDWSAYSQTGWGDSVASIQAHAPTHEWPNFQPGSDPLNVYMRAITPLRAQSAGTGSASIVVTAYEYDGATGTNYLWPGVPPLDLSAATPPTGSMRYMGVYLNPQSNTLGVVTGGVTVYTNALEPDRPTWPRNVFPSAYVRLYGGQSMVQERDIRDARRLFDTSLMFTGTPAALPQPIVTGTFLSGQGGTPGWISYPQATTANAGIVELATQAEVDTGTDTGRVITPATLRGTDDFYPAGDNYGLFDRLINWERSPDEHWPAGADQLTWAGWAAYTGFTTPGTITRPKSKLSVTHSGATRAFYYRSYINAQTSLYTVCGTSLANETGLMVDDGAGNVDGLGADNFVRVFIEYPTASANANLAAEYRTGGGAVTKTTYLSLPPQDLAGLELQYGVGTRWSSWTARIRCLGSTGIILFVANIATGLTWTPARHGLYTSIGATARTSVWDWFEEA